MLKLFIFFYITVIHFTYSLRTSDFCYPTELECKGFYIKNGIYKTSCEKTCTNNKYKCNEELCALNEKSCLEYKNRLHTLASIQILIKFKSKIKNCSKISFSQLEKSNWKADVCLNGLNCFKKHYIWIRNDYVEKTVRITCPCVSKKHSFKCGTDYCTLNNHTCSLLLLQQSNNATKFSIGMSKCNNGNNIIKQKNIIIF
jgi:hypothetical protein